MSRQRGWRCGLEGEEAGLRPGAHVEGAEAGLSASLAQHPPVFIGGMVALVPECHHEQWSLS